MGLWESVINCKTRKCTKVEFVLGEDEKSTYFINLMLFGTMMYHRDFFNFATPQKETLFQRIPFIGFSEGHYIYEKNDYLGEETAIRISVSPEGEKARIFFSYDKEFNSELIYKIIECSFCND